jgi:hypothetical protein
MTLAQELDPAVQQTFFQTLANHGWSLRRKRTEILQLNVGKPCNLTCVAAACRSPAFRCA